MRTDDNLGVEELIRWTMRTGDMSVAVMKKLDEANTEVYSNPSPQKVNVKMKKGPFIIVSGHRSTDKSLFYIIILNPTHFITFYGNKVEI